MAINQYIQKIITTTKLSSQEAWWLLQHVTGKTSTVLLLENSLSETEEKQLSVYLNQITIQHKPLAYIIGSVPFLDLTIKVIPPILIPRPETEQWVHQLILALQPYGNKINRILDIGTGSGVIALSLAKSFPKAQIFAVDINPQALRLTQENATLNQITNVTTIQSNLFASIAAGLTFDLIVSNPPYIDPAEQQSIDQGVTAWEDHHALFSNKCGLEIIEEIIKQAPRYLTSNNDLPYQLVFEHDRTQKEVIALLTQHDWYCSTQQDLFGKWRSSWCKLRQNSVK